MELELHNAISNFDIGAVTIIKLFQALGIPSSKYTQEACRLQDQHRVDIDILYIKMIKISKLKVSTTALVSFEQFNSWKLF